MRLDRKKKMEGRGTPNNKNQKTERERFLESTLENVGRCEEERQGEK